MLKPMGKTRDFYRGATAMGVLILLVYLSILFAGVASGSAELDLVLVEKVHQQNTLQEALITKLEMQVAFYEYILALDVEGCKEKARDARAAWDKMISEKDDTNE